MAIEWYVTEPFEAEAERLPDPTFAPHMPEPAFAEFGNIAWKKARRLKAPELTIDEGRHILGLLAVAPTTIHPMAPLLEEAYDRPTGPERSTVTVRCYLAPAVAPDCRPVMADWPFDAARRGGRLGLLMAWIADPR